MNQIDIEKNSLINTIKYKDNVISQLKEKVSSLEQTNLNLASENARMKSELNTHQIDTATFPKVKKRSKKKNQSSKKLTHCT